MKTGRRAIFLDRDGTVIRDPVYPRNPATVELLPGAAEGLTALKQDGYLLVVVSNQSGIGRGLVTPEEARQVHERFVSLLAESGVALDAAEYCFHTPERGCLCRKPKPGLLLRAADCLGIDLGRSWMVGDKESDAETAVRAGCRPLSFTGDWMNVVMTIRTAEKESCL
ncbi:MAG TPA: HAD family hydrolase [Gemmataceae bacterium]|jgi:histidinol-phosphate phosphatase family protein